jgi:polyisoprenoid-binding protein YceI
MKVSIFRTLLFALLVAPIASLFAGNGPIETYRVDVSASKIAWQGYKVTGKHNGTIQLKSGILQFQDGKLTGGQFVVDMATIECLDLQGGANAKLVGHLKSDDFFGVETFPTASLILSKVVYLDNNEYEVEGDLTIKGKTEKVMFKTTLDMAGNQALADASVKLDRSKFDVRYGSNSFFDNLGDKAIYDEFDLTISLVAGK